MHIESYYDESLAHASYLVLSGKEAVVIDPQRDPEPYLQFIGARSASLIGILETHPHADFVSSHLELHRQTGAPIYHSHMLGAQYEHEAFDEGDTLKVGSASIHPLHTPGHSPDSLTYLLKDSDDKGVAIFTGDTLFIGDVGRPDLREKAGHTQGKREELARMMYRTLQDKIKPLEDHLIVYPAHGAGSLCGKNMSDERSSTLGQQRRENWALQDITEDNFIDQLLDGQPHIPHYFGYAVELNRQGAPDLQPSLDAIDRLGRPDQIPAGSRIVDVRDEEVFKNNHYEHSYNIQLSGKFETWLGSIVKPEESFYLIAGSPEALKEAKYRAARIGYEALIRGGLVNATTARANGQHLDTEAFAKKTDEYTIVDIRQPSEAETNMLFDHATNIPLAELRERAAEIPTDKPVVVHCAGGYRSAVGYSILQEALPHTQIFDLSDDVEQFQ